MKDTYHDIALVFVVVNRNLPSVIFVLEDELAAVNVSAKVKVS